MCLAVLAIQVAIPFVPGVADAFHATVLEWSDWAVVAIVAFAPAVVAETVRTMGRTAWVA
jgi:hypothetical protein